MTILFRRKTVELEGEKWKPMSRKEVEAAIAAEPPNTRMRRYHSHQKYYEWELEKDRFLSIIWLNIKETGPLTPDGEPRTILDVAERMMTDNYDFESLIQCGFPWYRRCCKIESKFKHCKFGTIWLRGATEYERCKSPPGKYHIHEGAHRSLVLGKLLLEGKEYESVKAILIKTTGSTPPDKILD